MFGRALIWATAYGMARYPSLSLNELPALMNCGDRRHCGFEAQFLGDEALFGCQPARDFFPWTQTDGNVNVTGLSGVRMTDLVPSERIGELFDDLNSPWREGVNATHLGSSFVEIGRHNERVSVLRKGELCDLGVNHVVRKSLVGLPPRGKDHVRFPLSFIYYRFSEVMEARGINPEDIDVPDRELWELEDFLFEINGAMHISEWDFLHSLGQFRSMLNGDGRGGGGNEFWGLIEAVRAELEAEEWARRRRCGRTVHRDRSLDGIPIIEWTLRRSCE
jgi:hypothetical protein